MNIINNRGPHTDPCGTPVSSIPTLELLSSQVLNCLGMLRYDFDDCNGTVF